MDKNGGKVLRKRMIKTQEFFSCYGLTRVVVGREPVNGLLLTCPAVAVKLVSVH